MNISNERFPANIAFGAIGGPSFLTDVITMQNGEEQRYARWQQGRNRYNVSHALKTPAQIEELIAFFRARKGRAQAFLFKDWLDYRLTGEIIGIGDGTQTKFPLIKNYHSGNEIEKRRIMRPIAETINIYIDGEKTDFELAQDGIIIFSTPPASASIITADGEFDIIVRFDKDQLNATIAQQGIVNWEDITLVEVIY